jgi:excisionase family DNA binding protein
VSDQFLTTREPAHSLGVSKRTEFRMVERREITPVRLGGGFRFRLAGVEQLTARR